MSLNRKKNINKEMLRYIYIINVDNRKQKSSYFGHDNIYYVGQTNNLKLRLKQHILGFNSKFLKKNFPDALKIPVYVEYLFGNEYDAMDRELKIKNIPRKAKEDLINSDFNHVVGYNKEKKILILKKHCNVDEQEAISILA